MKFNAFRIGLVGTLGVGLGVLILTSIVTLSTIITYIGAALFLALGLDPFVSWLARKGWPRWAAISTVLVVVLGAVAGIVLTIIPILVSEIGKLVDQVPNWIRQVQDETWISKVNEQVPFLDLSAIVKNATDAVQSFFADPNQVGAVASGVLGAIGAIGAGVFGAVIVTILTIYFTVSLNSIKRGVYQLVPATKRPGFIEITEQITASVGRYVVGQIALASINGAASFIFLSIIQAPFPALLAVIAFALSLIPLVGTLSGSVLIVLASLTLGSPLTALVAAIYYVVYMQVEAYFLSPHIMNRAVQVPGAIVVIAALAGGSLLGVLGALIAIPVAASISLIVKQVVIPRQAAL